MNPYAKRVVLLFVNPEMQRIAQRESFGIPWRFFCFVLGRVETSKRDVSLGEIVMNPFARCILLRFVVSIPGRHASLGETCYASLS